MLEQLAQRSAQHPNSSKIIFQETQLRTEKLAEEEISRTLKSIVSNEGMINIDGDDFKMFERAEEVQAYLIEFEQCQFDKRSLSSLNQQKKFDILLVNIQASAEITLETVYQIMGEIEQYANEDAAIIVGADYSGDHLRLFILGGYGEIKEPIKQHVVELPRENKPEYYDAQLVEQFIDALRDNPATSIASLQRRYSIGFNRTAHNLDIAKARLQQEQA
ncbi:MULTISPECIES: hypothetical protein [Mannheimia]|uniref:Uncharacterized protein n=1 Tax=Mannheimia pernigra TaxID=111844 RepID=A0ABD7A964_9PAST|nr:MULTISPECIES: hypothetical protein [Mannheimia]QLB42452.1 hypothetical protein HV560_06315 [Mannheimia pernigra]QTM00318.1 hypothetical protein GM698_01120 [Mannheimia sp. ZY171111]